MKTNTTNTTIETHKTNTMPNLATNDNIFADFESEKLVSLISHLHYALAVIKGYMDAFKKMKLDEKDSEFALVYAYNAAYYDDIRWQSHDFFETIGSYETLITNLEKAECAAINCNYGIYEFYGLRTDTPLPLKLKAQRRQYDNDVLHVTSHLKEYLKGVISELECTDRESYLWKTLTGNLNKYDYTGNYENLVMALKIAERCMR